MGAAAAAVGSLVACLVSSGALSVASAVLTKTLEVLLEAAQHAPKLAGSTAAKAGVAAGFAALLGVSSPVSPCFCKRPEVLLLMLLGLLPPGYVYPCIVLEGVLSPAILLQGCCRKRGRNCAEELAWLSARRPTYCLVCPWFPPWRCSRGRMPTLQSKRCRQAHSATSGSSMCAPHVASQFYGCCSAGNV